MVCEKVSDLMGKFSTVVPKSNGSWRPTKDLVIPIHVLTNLACRNTVYVLDKKGKVESTWSYDFAFDSAHTGSSEFVDQEKVYNDMGMSHPHT